MARRPMPIGRALFVVICLVVIYIAPVRFASSLYAQEKTGPADKDNGAPVVVEGQTLFAVHERILSFSPEDRAKAISERIVGLSRQHPSQVLPIHIVDYETTSEIAARDFVVMAITDGEAKLLGSTRQEVARRYAQIIESTITALRSRHSARTFLLGVLYSVVATILLLATLTLIAIVYRRSRSYLESQGHQRLPSIRIQNLDLLTSHQIARSLSTLLALARAGGVLTILYIYISAVFSFFPVTQGYAAVLLQYVINPIRSFATSVVMHLPDFIFVLVVIVIARYLLKLVKVIFNELGAGNLNFAGFYADWAEPTYKIVRFAIIALTAAIILPSLPGYRSPAFQGVSLFVGVLFSLSSTAAVSNIVAGLALTYTRGFQVGDRVKIGETIGDVLEKTLLVTRVRTIKNVDISIPNSLVLANHMVNFSSSAKRDGLILHTTVTIGYDAPWRRVHQLLIDAALDTACILSEPRPYVLQTSLDDYYVSYEINAFTDKPNLMARTYSELHERIQDKFNEGGVEIMSPRYTSIRDGNDVTIPEQYRAESYLPKVFRVEPSERSSDAQRGA